MWATMLVTFWSAVNRQNLKALYDEKVAEWNNHWVPASYKDTSVQVLHTYIIPVMLDVFSAGFCKTKESTVVHLVPTTLPIIWSAS